MALKMNRRTFLSSAAASCLSLGVGGWWAYRVQATDGAEMIAAAVRKKLHYLQLDKAGLLAFGRDARARLNGGEQQRLGWMRWLSPVYDKVDLLSMSPRAEKFRQFEERLAKQFLMSSDFFSHDGDQTRKIRYVAYHDPYELACANPFALFDEEGA